MSAPVVPWAALAAGAAVITVVAVDRARRAHRSAVVAARLGPVVPSPAPPPWFLRGVVASGLTIRPERAWTGARAAGALVLLLSGLRWPLLVVAAGAVGVVGHRVHRRSRQATERRGYDATLVAAIDGIVSRLASGASLGMALREVAGHPSPVGRDLAGVARRLDHGQGVQVALDRWAAERGTPGARLVADSLAIAGMTGGSQRSALLGVQATLRDREALAREVRALGSQARTSGVVLAITPLAFAGVVAMVDARVAAFFGTPAGWGCVIGGLVLNAVGALWMHRLGEALA